MVAINGLNTFVLSEELVPVEAYTKGFKYNLTLLTNFYFNFYVPVSTLDEVSNLTLTLHSWNAVEPISSTEIKSLNGADYIYARGFELSSFAVYARTGVEISYTVNYEGKDYQLSAATGDLSNVSDNARVNIRQYINKAVEQYECGSAEMKLLLTLAQYVTAAYNCQSDSDLTVFDTLLGKHTTCGCLKAIGADYATSADESLTYKTLAGHGYGFALEITHNQPQVIVQVPADKYTEGMEITVAIKTGMIGAFENRTFSFNLTTNGEAKGEEGSQYYEFKGGDENFASYNICETLYITVGDTTVTYSLAEYMHSVGASDSEASLLVQALIEYSKAARAYKIATAPKAE
jgi:hypothetical protein